MPGKAVLRQNGRGQRPWCPVQPSPPRANQVLWERALGSSTRVCGTAHLEQVQHPRAVERPPSLHVFQHHRHQPAVPVGREEIEEVGGAPKDEEMPACKQEDNEEAAPEVGAPVPHVKEEPLPND